MKKNLLRIIQKWHVGKLAILWAWVAIGELFCVLILKEHRQKIQEEHLILGFMLLGAMGLMPIALTTVTWIWFGGKERLSDNVASTNETRGQAIAIVELDRPKVKSTESNGGGS